MNFKILKLSAVFLLLLFMGAGCQKDDWQDIELNGTCTDGLTEVKSYISEQKGTVTLFGTSGINFYIESEANEVWPEGALLAPCNLPNQLIKEGQEIIFSGEIHNWSDWGNDSVVIDYYSIPIVLSKAKIKN